MTKILFVCHGNICRSPMAEYVMKDLVRQSGREDEFVIASAATSREELGNPVYPPARRKLAEHGIRCDGHAARQMTRKDYEEFGYLIGMDRMNLSNMARICGGDRKESARCCWRTPGEAAMWLTRGIPVILKPPGRMSTLGAGHC